MKCLRISIGFFIFSSAIAFAQLSELNPIGFTQVTCVGKTTDKRNFEFRLDFNTKQEFIWPDRVTLFETKGPSSFTQFTALDVFKDLFFEDIRPSVRRYIAKNYDDPSFNYKQVAFTFDTSLVTVMGEDPFPLSLDFYGRMAPIFEGLLMNCKKSF
jgi:hypothetical protein